MRLTNAMRLVFAMILILFSVLAIVLVIATDANAESVEVPIGVLRGDPGQVFPIATVPANAGNQCVAELEARNNRSIHPDSDVLVGPVTFFDVESTAFQAGGLSFTATGDIDIAVRLGADGVFSAGFVLEVTCNPPESTTTSEASSTSSTSTSSPESPTTTTTTLSPPPSGPVEAGGGVCAEDQCNEAIPWLEIAGIIGLFILFTGLVAATFNYFRRNDE